jgi:N4-gp56 family major capsid protein
MVGQLWVTDSLGGYLYSDELSRDLRTAVQPQVKFRQFCDARDATMEAEGKQLRKGQLYTWDVISDVQTQGGTLVETATMPETQFTVTQGTLTITEFGNSVPYTGKLDNLSAIPLKGIISKQLKNDAKKAFDIYAHAEFNRTPLRVVPAGGTSTTSLSLTTNGTATGTNNVALRKEHVRLISQLMKERNIPPYLNDDYMSVAWPSCYFSLKGDLETIHQYTDRGLGMIMNGEIGRYDNVRFVEQTQIPKGGAADSTTWSALTNTADAWNNGLSDWAFFFGEDTVTEALVIPEEIRGKIPTDFGRSMGVAWYALDGFGIVHTTPSQARILKWDSAV